MQMHPVDDDIEMAAAIGRCSNNWTHTEAILAWIFCYLTETNIAVAVTVFSFFKSTRMQSDVLKRLAQMVPFMTDPLRARLSELLTTYEGLAGDRNKLLHNPLGRNNLNEVYIMVRAKRADYDSLPYETHPISKEQIDQLSAKITEMNRGLHELESQLRKAKFGEKFIGLT